MSQVKLILKDGTELMLDAIKLPEDLVKVYQSWRKSPAFRHGECQVEQDDPAGTENHPIEWMDGIALIENAYYVKPDGLLYVCKNGELTLF